ncbi:MAG: asparagine synthase (glutamine-hydrolyzing) [Flavipsychrobacter sp.]
MCGITGYYVFNNGSNDNLTKVAQSTDKLYLRGPDSGGHFNDDRIALGHRRLSIIDTSEGATQPMTDATGRYTIVFNGEIFNYQQLSINHLKDTWARIGGAKTTSDTEVLLYLLIEYGTKCLPWLSGFFAFAFYDHETKQVILARDRFGKKPLLYHANDKHIAFASEMKSLLAWDIPKELDYNVLLQYLQLNYVPQPQSMLKGVAKLKQAHYMICTPTGIKEYQPYYEIEIKKEAYNNYSYDAAQQELVQLMDDSVKERMISDVPLGAFLSGGIDSSVMVALASKYTNNLNTFSVGYKDNPYFDETKYAQLVAKKYNTNHTVFSLTTNDFLEHVHDVLDYIDEPFADSSAIPVYILCKNTRKHVTVAISGDGGDEIFAGYNKHAAEWKVRQSSMVNQIVKAGLPIWKMLPRSRNNKVTNIFRQLHRFAEGAQLSDKERYWRWASFNTANQAGKLLRPEVMAKTDTPLLQREKDAILKHINNGGDYNEVLLTDMNLVLISDMLVKVDLMSMANSLEVRSPFLDYKVVDFAFTLPEQYKIDGSMKKRIVQDAFRDMLPEEIYNRPKHGFEIPLLGWFRNELWGLINDDLLQKDFVAQQGIFNVEEIEALKRKLRSNNPEDSHATIWALIVFQHWWKKHLS